MISLVSFLVSAVALANHQSFFNFPDKLGSIFWNCESQLCNVYLKKRGTAKILIMKDAEEPVVEVLSKGLVSIFFSCGSPCNYTIYYDLENRISRPFEFVIAIDVEQELVSVVEKNQLIIYKIFDIKKSYT